MLSMTGIRNLVAIVGNLRCKTGRSFFLLPLLQGGGWLASLVRSRTCRGWVVTKANYSGAGCFALAWTRPESRGRMECCRGSKVPVSRLEPWRSLQHGQLTQFYGLTIPFFSSSAAYSGPRLVFK
ncbi:hypothetical protein EDD15DRAFT_2534107, partial [Pisolithus albus]